jgi:hypothetical protein
MSSELTHRRPRRSSLALVLLATTAFCAPAAADFPATIELSALDGTTGFRLDGIDNGDFAGEAVAAADINGDGFDDVVIGARGADPGGRSFAGEVYVVFGRPSFPAAVALSSLDGTNGFRLDGAANGDGAGNAVARAGDVNGDGFDDIVIGAVGFGSGEGASYVLFGKPGPFAPATTLSALDGTNGFRIDGVASPDYSANAVSGAGDHNGDGFDDILIGAARADRGGESDVGESYVVFGGASFPPVLALSSLDGTNGYTLLGVDPGDSSGLAVAGGGDFDNDGFDDILIGAPFADTPPPPAAGSRDADGGEGYLAPGGPDPFSETSELDRAGEIFGLLLQGSAAFGSAARAFGLLADVNGDTREDLYVAIPGADADTGSVVTFFGRDDSKSRAITPRIIELESLDGTDGFRLEGGNSGDFNGSAVTGGDLNADGFGDLASGAPRAAPGGRSDAGRSYALFGNGGAWPAAIDVSTLNGDNGFAVNGAASDDYSGSALAAGDINGDGVDDLIIGAKGDLFGSTPGKVHVVFGRVPDEAVTRRGSVADQYISGGPFADKIFAGGGNDRVEGRGGPDRLSGGPGKRDLAVYLHAPDGMTVNLLNPAANTGDAAGDTYKGIEGIEGSRFADSLTGNNQANDILGHEGEDSLNGMDGPDRLIGGPGRDSMKGGPGGDIFELRFVGDSVAGALRDNVLDFSFVEGDRIGLRDIDAKSGEPGNQAFTFIGTAAFSGQEGQLRVGQSGPHTIVSGDVNGDSNADLEIKVRSTSSGDFTAGNFLR